MKILDENAKWWIGSEKEWAYQAKNGDWWIIKNEEKNNAIAFESISNYILMKSKRLLVPEDL